MSISQMHLDLGLNQQPRHVLWLGINWQPFTLRESAQPTEPHQTELLFLLFIMKYTKRKIQKTEMIIQVPTIQLLKILFCPLPFISFTSANFLKEKSIMDLLETLFKPLPNPIPLTASQKRTTDPSQTTSPCTSCLKWGQLLGWIPCPFLF